MKNKITNKDMEQVRLNLEKMNYIKNMVNKLMKLDNKQLIGIDKLINGDIEGIKDIFKQYEIELFIKQEQSNIIDEKIEDYKIELIKHIRGY